MIKKTILITGATRGIGWSLAQQAAQQNYRVILTGRNSNLVQQRKEQLLQKFPASQVQSIVLDVCNRRMIKSVAQNLGKIDVLINNAGIIADDWWVNLSCQDWDRVIATNLTGAFNVTHYLSSHLKPGGQIIMLTSQSALLGNPGQSNYAASKAGVIGLTKTLAVELKRFSLKVNCVAPAAITDMTRPVIEKIKQKHHGKLPAEWQLGSSQTVATFIINHVLNSEKNGMIYAVNGAKIGYWEPIFHQLTSKGNQE
ncbi:SDR family NAD(P)-dependent oxidoreductase [Lactobacillus helveticus]|uniref:SDR family NAD(P)-dependent oxidoreductase n=1 Tax=Lactobacillus helveticus TaxID=1587 RepID=UPI0015628BDA|nr:SDR family NAD(P)-dependent oxidoreductase [Lactobacillus helveticus]NRN89958.1 3-oxoacyl-[acyl-carrier-protein] reductase FabG [Lactobacillus helveticus]NRO45630.1 3-oxoacyl-[acyl-carrier-protein] reductase FabG [Lactobacillus helveticus]NRO55328.1 3-oxoacyl-[acyl-carrier-protein] reductase FabG [Lactobacillus helveticus]